MARREVGSKEVLSLRSKVRWCAIYSRGFVLVLQMLANFALPNHESSDGFRWVRPNGQTETPPEQLVSLSLDGLSQWDAQHFLHVAQHGYTYQHSLAFFPLFPLVTQTAARALAWIAGSGTLSFESCLKLSAAYVNLVSFVFAADRLYALSRRILRDECLAYRAALLFCLNPASVFFTAAYSESLYAACAFSAMLALEERGPGTLSGAWFAAATATRSNGVVNVGFALYHSMKTVATTTILYVREKKKMSAKKKSKTPKRPSQSNQDSEPEATSPATNTLLSITSQALLPGVLNVLMALAPFVAFQWYAYTTFCVMDADSFELSEEVVAEANEKGYILPGSTNKSSWCFDDPPVSYTYIQRHYWNVGFLNYWEKKQLPQFVLATPVISLVLWQAYLFWSSHTRYSQRLGLVDNTQLGLPKPRNGGGVMTATLALPRPCFVYVVHASSLALLGLIWMHVQVTTRMICSSSPLLYWFCALLTVPSNSDLVPMDDEEATGEEKKPSSSPSYAVSLKVEHARNLESRRANVLLMQEEKTTAPCSWVKMYFLGYTLIGTVLFSNGYPWT